MLNLSNSSDQAVFLSAKSNNFDPDSLIFANVENIFTEVRFARAKKS